jgi:hypothetical protein
MQIPQDVRAALDKACQLAPTMHGYTVRQESPTISTGHAGEVIIRLDSSAPEVMDPWIRLCQTRTNGVVSTNTRTKTVTVTFH